MLIKQMHQKNVVFVIIVILKLLLLSMNHIFAMVVMISWKNMSFDDVPFLYVKESAYRIRFWYMSKDYAKW